MAAWDPRAKELFLNALDLGSPGERQAYLSTSCGDDASLRQVVEALLQAHAAAGSLLEHNAAGAGPADTRTTALPQEGDGTIIGNYKLLQLIGEGGFGSVFMAEQELPFRRKVALKIIKLGMDTRQVIARFEAERQALAMMDHPNIARVFEAGATESGRPYFVMELVKGVPITQYCDEQSLTSCQRVELFIQVCRAVQHAHQKGVIHRDIKPGNVLVTMHDDKAVPKVIDFGIAKATGDRLTDKTLFTEYRQFLGTPTYMSPEQAQMSGLDIDTRSDIYSLGVLLYELLTGQTPFDAKALLSAAYDEMRRIIREVDPPKPSTRISSLGATLAGVAKHRSIPPGKLAQSVRGELDWIVMKALEKDRTRRYETANALARDLERHLSDEPIMARPTSAAYRVQKFIRRHTAAVAAGAMVILALVLGICGTTLGLVRSQRNAALVRKEKDQLKITEQRALAGEALAIKQTLAMQIELAHRLVSEGEVLRANEHWGDAIDRYSRASQLLEKCGQPRFEADMGLWECSPHVPLLNSFGDRAADITCAEIFPSGREVITGGNDGVVRVWDLLTGREMLTLRGHGGAVRSVAVSADGARAVSGGVDGSARVWDVRGGVELRAFRQHAGSVNAVAIGPDGSQVFSGGDDGVLWVWDMRTAKGIRSLAPKGVSLTPIYALCLSKDGGIAVTGSEDWYARIWDLNSDQLLASLKTSGRPNPIQSVALSPSRRILVAGEGSIGRHIFRYSLGPAMTAPGYSIIGDHLNVISSLAFLPNERELLSASLDKTLVRWNLLSGARISFGDQSGWVSALKVTADGNMALSAGALMRLWDLNVTLEPRTLRGDDYFINGIAVSLDGRLAASGGDARVGIKSASGSTAVRVWDVATGRTIYVLEGHGGPVWSTAFSPDGSRLLSASDDGTVRLWNVADGKPLGIFTRQGAVRAIAFCDASRFVSGGDDKFMHLWEIGKDQPLASWAGDGAAILGVAASGEFAACGDAAGTITIAKLTASHPPRRLTSHPQTQWRSVAFSADGKLLAAGNVDGTTDLWDVAGGHLIRSNRAHAGEVTAVAFWPDGSKFVSGGTDAALAIWDVGDGRELHRFMISQTNSIAVSGDGGLLISGGMGRAIQIRDLTLAARSRALEVQVAESQAKLQQFSNDGNSLAALGQWYAMKEKYDWAIELLERARSGGGEIPSMTLARCYVRTANFPAAAVEFQRALNRREAPEWYLQLCENALAQPAASEYFALALASVRAGNPQTASVQLARAIEIEPTHEPWWNVQACLLALVGDTERYQSHCRAMLDRFKSNDDPAVTDHVCKALLLLPGSQSMANPMLRYDRLVAAKTPGFDGSTWYALTKGMAEYRAGRMTSCIDWMNTARRGITAPAVQASADFFTAMACHDLGRADEAQDAMRQAQTIMQTKVEPSARVPPTMENWLIVHIAAREAESTLQRGVPLPASAPSSYDAR